MNTKQSPRKVTLAMIKGKPITTSVPVIHYHASDDELEEIYPSSEEEKRLTPECETNVSKVTSTSSKRIEKRCVHESDVSENNSETRSVGTENVLPEGTQPSLDPWKVLSDFKGRITKTFEEKLSEIKSDKKKRRHSKAESSSDLEETQGSVTPCEKKQEGKQVNEESSTMMGRHQRGNPVRYVGFSDVKTGLKDKSLQDESVESGVEASEFAQSVNEDIVSCPENDFSTAKASSNREDDYAKLRHQPCTRFAASPKRIDLKTVFLRLMKQLILQTTYKSVAIFIAIFSIYHVAPLPEYLLGFIMGIIATITFCSTLTEFQRVLTTMPDEKFDSPTIIPVLEIPAAEEHSVIERFQGWLNELPYNYEPNNYHVARTKSVFFRLEGNILRIMETRMKIPKKAVWDEPKQKLKFVRRRVYNLAGARIELVPYGLARKRRWSKKYPICITLKKGALICNVTLKSSINEEYSINDYYRKGASKGRVKYKVDRKRVGNWGEESLVDGEGDESTKGKRKDEEKDVEDEGEDSYYNCDTNNDDIDNDYIEYEECFLKNEGVTEYMVEEERKRKGRCYKKGQQKEFNRIRRNLRKRRKKVEKSFRMNWKGEEKELDEKEEESKKEKEKGRNPEERYEKEDKNVEMEMMVGNKLDIDEEEDEEEEEEDEEAEEVDYDEFILDYDEVDAERDYYDDDDDYDDEYDNDDDDNDEDDADEDDDDDEVDEELQQVNEEGKDFDEVDKGNGNEAKMTDDDNDCGIDAEKGERIELKSTFKKLNKKSKQRNELKIFVFARADREKEDWYRRLISAASRRVKKQDSLSFNVNASSASNASLTAQRNVIAESKGSLSANSSHEKCVPELSYNAYMAKYLDANGCTSKLENSSSATTDNTLWFNCLIARVLFDIHRCPETINVIQDKIQRKLSSIKLPYFMECLLVSEVTIGQGAPTIRNITKPIINERGLWLDFDIMYKGSLTMTVETKLNLMKLTRTGSVPSNSNVIVPTEKDESIVRSAIFDSDLEDTPETSTEDEDDSTTRLCNTAKETTATQSSGRKFLSMVDKIAANKYFQHATELSYVRRAMEGVSNTEIRLMVTVSSIEGSLSVNIPPAPSDRLWYGFKPVPKVTLTVKPAVGERTVNIVYVTKWIEAKLLREFEKLVVLPNMDDLVVPLCPNYPYTTTR
nr:testis-expressed protein 2 [Osmia lignaria]